jgi:hypothetical protein
MYSASSDSHLGPKRQSRKQEELLPQPFTDN